MNGTILSIRSKSQALIWLLLPLVIAGLVIAFPTLAWDISLPRKLGTSLTIVPLALFVPACWLLMARAFSTTRELAMPVIIVLLIASQLNGIGAGPLDIFDIALLALFCFWVHRLCTEHDRTIRLSILFFAASALSVLAIAHLPVLSPVPWFIGVFGIVRVTILTLMIVDLCRQRDMLNTLSNVFITVAAVSAFVGIIQFLLAFFGIYYFSFITPLESAFKPTPIGFVMRASALNSTAQHFSSYMVYALPFALWQFSLTPRPKYLLVLGLILSGLFVSLNFGGIFAGALVVIVFPFLRWPHLRLHFWLIGGLVLGLCYYAGILSIIYDLTIGDDGISKGVDQRKTLFILGLETIDRSPLIGTGLRGFGDVNGNFWDRPVHNLFGQAAAELGVFGVLIFVGIFVYLITNLILIVKMSGKATRYPSIMLLVVLAALLLAQTEPNLEHSNLWLMLGLAQSVILIWRRPLVLS